MAGWGNGNCRRLIGLLSIAALLSVGRCQQVSAQPDSEGRTLITSVRPILVAVQFNGNASISSAIIQSRIRTRPTLISHTNQYAKIAEDLSVLDRWYLFLRQMGEGQINLRYLNTSIVDADKVEIQKLYSEYGFQQAKVGSHITVDREKNIAVVDFVIEEGEQFTVRSFHTEGLVSIPESVKNKLDEGQLVRAGDALNIQSTIAEIDRTKGVLADNGYPFPFEFKKPEIIYCEPPSTDCVPYTDSVVIFVTPGQRYRIDTTLIVDVVDTTSGRPEVRHNIIEAQYAYRNGEWYSFRELEETRKSLYSLGIFDRVSYDVDTASGLTDSTTLLRLRYSLKDENEVEAGLELSMAPRNGNTIFLMGASARYSRQNLFHAAHRWTIGGRVQSRIFGEAGRLIDGSEFEASFTTRYEMPLPKGKDQPGSGLTAVDFVPNFLAFNGGFTPQSVEDQVNGAQLRSLRYFANIEANYRFPSYTLFTGLIARLNLFSHTNYQGIGSYITNKAEQRVDAAEILDGCTPADVTAQVVRSLATNIYRVQVLQGDSLELMPSGQAQESGGRLQNTSSLALSLLGDHRDNIFNPRNGAFYQAQGELGLTGLSFSSFQGALGAFAKLEGEGRVYRPIGLKSAFAFRTHLGWIFQFGEFPLTPIASRFHAGGATSNRGWGPREMLATSPPPTTGDTCANLILTNILDESRRLLGGLALLEINIEARLSVAESWVVVPFVDIGNAYFRNYSDDKPLVNVDSMLKYTGIATGFEVGYITPAGPVRIGLGLPLYDPIYFPIDQAWVFNREDRFNLGWLALQFSIGYAF